MLIMVAILVLFGANKIPELARGLGKGIREFKDASREIRSEFESHVQPQQPYQQQLNPNYIAPTAPPPAAEHLPDDAYTQTEPSYTASGTPYVAPAPFATNAELATPAPTTPERPRLDQMS